MTRTHTRRRALPIAICATLVAAILLALPAYRERTAHAYADEVRTEVARSYRDTRSWRAHVEERELVGEGVYRTTRYRIVVAGPDRYRVEAVERDERGREVTAVTLRDGTTVISSTQVQGEPPRVLEIRNVPPALGSATDNVLGQRVRDIARATSARYVGRDKVRGRPAIKLAVEPGHLVWVDGESSMPVREQLLADDTVTHELEVLLFEQDATIGSEEFVSPSLSGGVRTVEDLGFAQVMADEAPTGLLGFAPRAIEAPADWSLVTSGYVVSGTGEGAPAAPVWIAQYDTPDGPVLVTQSQVRADDRSFRGVSDGTEGPHITTVDGRTVAYYADEWRTHATVEFEDVRVIIEGLMGPEELLPSVAWLR